MKFAEYFWWEGFREGYKIGFRKGFKESLKEAFQADKNIDVEETFQKLKNILLLLIKKFQDNQWVAEITKLTVDQLDTLIS